METGECSMCAGDGGQADGGRGAAGGVPSTRAPMASSSSPPPSPPPDAAPSQAAVFAALKALSQDVYGVSPDVYARSPGELCVCGGQKERAVQRWRSAPTQTAPLRVCVPPPPPRRPAPPARATNPGFTWWFVWGREGEAQDRGKGVQRA